MSIELEEIRTCPLGHTCKKISGDKIEKCMWLIGIRGENPQTGVEEDREDCAIAFTPLAILENARYSKGTQSAIESERNEVNKLNQVFQTIIETGNRNKKLGGNGSSHYLVSGE